MRALVVVGSRNAGITTALHAQAACAIDVKRGFTPVAQAGVESVPELAGGGTHPPSRFISALIGI